MTDEQWMAKLTRLNNMKPSRRVRYMRFCLHIINKTAASF